MIITLAIGSFSSLLGLGGGILIVPYLRVSGIAIKQAIGVSTACIFTLGFIGSLSYAINGIWLIGTDAYRIGFVYWPAFIAISLGGMLFAPLGASLTAKLAVKYLNVIFIVCIAVAAIKLIFF